MSNRRIIHDLSDEELLALAQGAKAEEVLGEVSEAAKFIYEMKIREGNTKISAIQVYHMYKDWCGRGNVRTPRRRFFRDFNRYFKPFRAAEGIHYMLDGRTFDTSVEHYFEIRADLREERKKIKKKQNKVPKSDQEV